MKILYFYFPKDNMKKNYLCKWKQKNSLRIQGAQNDKFSLIISEKFI